MTAARQSNTADRGTADRGTAEQGPTKRGTTGRDTVGVAIQEAIGILAAAGVESPRLDAQVLLGFTLNVTREVVFGYPERVLTGAEQRDYGALIERRASRQPVAQIVGRQEFWGRDFKVTADTLIPRADSETIIAAVLNHLPTVLDGEPISILDLGVGTGCLVLTLLAEIPGAIGTGVDLSAAALDVARENSRALGVHDRVRFLVSDWCSALPRDARFDIVVTNPPYIADHELAALAPEVSVHEPAAALGGGPDGLDAYRRLGPQLARVLAPRGIAAVEVGAGQISAVARILTDGGLIIRGINNDIAGIERCIICGPKKIDLKGKLEVGN